MIRIIFLFIHIIWLTEKLLHLLSSVLTKQLLQTIFIISQPRELSMFCLPKLPSSASFQPSKHDNN